MAKFKYKAKAEHGGDIRYGSARSKEHMASKHWVDANTIKEIDAFPIPDYILQRLPSEEEQQKQEEERASIQILKDQPVKEMTQAEKDDLLELLLKREARRVENG